MGDNGLYVSHALDVLGSGHELTNGTSGPVDAVMGAATGLYRISRLR